MFVTPWGCGNTGPRRSGTRTFTNLTSTERRARLPWPQPMRSNRLRGPRIRIAGIIRSGRPHARTSARTKSGRRRSRSSAPGIVARRRATTGEPAPKFAVVGGAAPPGQQAHTTSVTLTTSNQRWISMGRTSHAPVPTACPACNDPSARRRCQSLPNPAPLDYDPCRVRHLCRRFVPLLPKGGSVAPVRVFDQFGPHLRLAEPARASARPGGRRQARPAYLIR